MPRPCVDPRQRSTEIVHREQEAVEATRPQLGPKRPLDRRSIRLPGYDYRWPGAYFVTVCTHIRQCILSRVAGDAVELTPLGRIALACWNKISEHIANTEPGPVIIMPNHLHGIVVLADTDPSVGVRHASPLRVRCSSPLPAPSVSPLQPAGTTLVSAVPRVRPKGTCPDSLGAIVASYKAAVTRQARGTRLSDPGSVWQRGFGDT